MSYWLSVSKVTMNMQTNVTLVKSIPMAIAIGIEVIKDT